jgi:hypothetical protein
MHNEASRPPLFMPPLKPRDFMRAARRRLGNRESSLRFIGKERSHFVSHQCRQLREPGILQTKIEINVKSYHIKHLSNTVTSVDKDAEQEAAAPTLPKFKVNQLNLKRGVQ